ncbi:hypothetical protein L1887_62139 [Cichorium endivia]|nr:hypothetical protein L1887_62139 [Cichorium endivia]
MQSLWAAVETALVGYVREPLCGSSCPRAACTKRPSSCSSPHHLARPSNRCRLGFRDLSWPAPRSARRVCLRWSASTSDERPCSSWWLARIHLLAVLSIQVATWLRYGQRRGSAWRVMYLAVYPTPRDTRANIDDEWHLAAVVLVQHLLHLRGGQMVKGKALRAVKRHAVLVAGGKEAMFGFFRRKMQAYKSASCTSSLIHGFANIDPARSRRCCRAESQARPRQPRQPCQVGIRSWRATFPRTRSHRSRSRGRNRHWRSLGILTVRQRMSPAVDDKGGSCSGARWEAIVPPRGY